MLILRPRSPKIIQEEIITQKIGLVERHLPVRIIED
jgi:hypothetical protein